MRKTLKIIAVIFTSLLVVGGFYYGYEQYNKPNIPVSNPQPVKNNSTTPPPPEPPKYIANVIGTSSNPYNYVPIKQGAIGTDLWNIKSAKGETNMTLSNNHSLYVNSSFSNVQSGVNTILGYPEIAYGYNLEDQLFGNSQSSSLRFPVKFSTFENSSFNSTVNYSFTNLNPKAIPIDFSYDLWLEGNPTPLQNPTQGDLEVMIWMYSQDNQPIGTQVGSFNSSITFDHKQYNSKWEVWYGKANAWPTVSFVLQYPGVASHANISLNISKFISYGGIVSNENVSNHTLMGIEMGNEFGNENISTNISNWVLSYYAFEANKAKINMLE